MNLRQAGDVARAVSFSPRKTGSPSVQMECVRALRRELSSTFPSVNLSALLGILRAHRLGEFPEAFLLGGRLRDLSPDGAIARLRIAHDAAASRATPWHPLFSNEFYEATNPDVAAAGVPLWLHYQVHGSAEGRSPHPLVDVPYLASSLPGVRRSETLDAYLTHPGSWSADTSPYVDSGRFALEGPWDGHSNPLTQMVVENRGEPWVHGRLMVVDAGSRGTGQRALGAAILLARSRAAGNFSAIASWTPSDGRPDASGSAAAYVVVPGYFLAADGRELVATSSARMSDDATVIRLADEVLSLSAGPAVDADELLYLDSELTRPELVAALERPGGTLVVAPFSAAQQFALEQLVDETTARVTVLAHGRQASVAAGRLAVVRSQHEPSAVAAWEWPSDADPASVAVVIPESNRRRSTNDPLVRDALRSGAALCIVGPYGIADWMPILLSRTHVVVDRAVVQLVLGVVDPERVWQLAGGEVGNQS